MRDPIPPTPPADAATDPFLLRPDVAAAVRGPLALYAAARLSGRVRKDLRQEAAVLELQRVFANVAGGAAAGARSGLTMVDAMPGDGDDGGGWFGALFGGGSDAGATKRGTGVDAPRGLYMFGGVGSGKTMLMDMFVEALGGTLPVRER